MSRVGGSAQTKAMKQVAKSLRLDLAQFKELESFSQFGAELDKDTADRIEKGKRVQEVLKQNEFTPRDVSEQVVVMYAAVHDYLNDVEVENVVKFEREFLEFMHSNYPNILSSIDNEAKILDSTEEELKKAIEAFKMNF